MRLAALSIAFALAALVGCSEAERTRTLNFVNWSLYHDPQTVRDFEAALGVEVNTMLYETNEELLAKLELGGTEQYDVIVVSDYNVEALIARGLLAKLDPARLANRSNLDPTLLGKPFDRSNDYTVPYLWGMVGIAYRKDILPTPEQTWGLIFDPERQTGRFMLLDSTREMMAGALRYLGRSANSTSPADLGAAAELLIAAKRRSVGFDANPAIRIGNGQAVYGVVYNGNTRTAGHAQLSFFVPREGSSMFIDSYAIPADARNADLAHAFIDFMLRPEVAARNATVARHATANRAARPLIPAQMLTDPVIYPRSDATAPLELLTDVGDALRYYDAAWTRIKAR